MAHHFNHSIASREPDDDERRLGHVSSCHETVGAVLMYVDFVARRTRRTYLREDRRVLADGGAKRDSVVAHHDLRNDTSLLDIEALRCRRIRSVIDAMVEIEPIGRDVGPLPEHE